MSKEYENAKITKEKIKKAFFVELSNNPINKVSVNNIITRIGINRGTFYIHYKSISDLILEIANEFLTEYSQILKNANIQTAKDFVNVICQTAEQQKQKLFVIIKSNCMQRIVTQLNDLLYPYVLALCKSDNEQSNKITSMFVASGSVWALREAIANNYSISQIQTTLNNIISHLI